MDLQANCRLCRGTLRSRSPSFHAIFPTTFLAEHAVNRYSNSPLPGIASRFLGKNILPAVVRNRKNVYFVRPASAG